MMRMVTERFVSLYVKVSTEKTNKVYSDMYTLFTSSFKMVVFGKEGNGQIQCMYYIVYLGVCSDREMDE